MSIIDKYNLTDLYKKLNNVIGADLKWDAEIRINPRDEIYLYIESSDISELAGIFGPLCKRLYIGTVVSEFYSDYSDPYILWMSMSIIFEYKEGTCSNCDFLMIFLDKNNNWSVSLR